LTLAVALFIGHETLRNTFTFNSPVLRNTACLDYFSNTVCSSLWNVQCWVCMLILSVYWFSLLLHLCKF